MSEFHITFAIEPALTKKQQRHIANELALFGLDTKWIGNQLLTNGVNRVHANFSSNNCITVTDNYSQS